MKLQYSPPVVCSHFQAITLLASNMTFDDLTLTVLAPTSLTFSPLSSSEGGVIPYTDLSCTHLCLRSRVPLGYVTLSPLLVLI